MHLALLTGVVLLLVADGKREVNKQTRSDFYLVISPKLDATYLFSTYLPSLHPNIRMVHKRWNIGVEMVLRTQGYEDAGAILNGTA